MKAWKHFKTITKHKIKVGQLCFRIGLYKQGILHDMSKYSLCEFLTGARYYQGTKSLMLLKGLRKAIQLLGFIIKEEISITGNFGLILLIEDVSQQKYQSNTYLKCFVTVLLQV